MNLHDYFERGASRNDADVAVEEADGSSLTYGELVRLSDRVRDRLTSLGVEPGDRVGLYLRKSIDTVASIFGVLKAGAAYVPVDPRRPPCATPTSSTTARSRRRSSRGDSSATLEAVLANAAGFRRSSSSTRLGGGADSAARSTPSMADAPAPPSRRRVSPDERPRLHPLHLRLDRQAEGRDAQRTRTPSASSTGAREAFEPTPADRFSSHAPFHFDLSILDIYTPLQARRDAWS